MSNLKFVSIIIPVFNNRKGLNKTLRAIDQQTYPKNKFEIIVVDNGSNDAPDEVVKHFQEALNIRFLKQLEYPNSPYSSRNRGIEIAKGNIIVLLDSTCAPLQVWLEAGVMELKNGADLVAGNITFDINKKSSIGEMYDSLSNIRMKDTVEQKNAAKTGNLFIKKEVFERIGNFPEGLRSGGDVRWTYKATQSGFDLFYSEEAEVIIMPRGLKDLIQKQYRVGKGQPNIWKESGSFISNFIKKVVLFWLPPNPLRIKSWINQSDNAFLNQYFIQLFLTGWFLRGVNAMGCLFGMLRIKKRI